MEKVATSKIKKSTDAYLETRPYRDSLYQLAVDLLFTSYHYPGTVSNRLFLEGKQDPKQVLLIVLSSDRGLCGGFNSGILETAFQYETELIEAGKQVSWLPIGKKAVQQLRHTRRNYEHSFTDLDEHDPSFEQTLVTETLIPGYFDDTYDEIYMVYRHYYSVSVQKPLIRRILPLPVMESITELKDELQSLADAPSVTTIQTSSAPEVEKPEIADLEPESDLGLEVLFPQLLQAMLFLARKMNIVSENIVRRVAMKQATDAATDVIRELKKTYNRTRQAKITNELIEIVSAAKAVKK